MNHYRNMLIFQAAILVSAVSYIVSLSINIAIFSTLGSLFQPTLGIILTVSPYIVSYYYPTIDGSRTSRGGIIWALSLCYFAIILRRHKTRSHRYLGITYFILGLFPLVFFLIKDIYVVILSQTASQKSLEEVSAILIKFNTIALLFYYLILGIAILIPLQSSDTFNLSQRIKLISLPLLFAFITAFTMNEIITPHNSNLDYQYNPQNSIVLAYRQLPVVVVIESSLALIFFFYLNQDLLSISQPFKDDYTATRLHIVQFFQILGILLCTLFLLDLLLIQQELSVVFRDPASYFVVSASGTNIVIGIGGGVVVQSLIWQLFYANFPGGFYYIIQAPLSILFILNLSPVFLGITSSLARYYATTSASIENLSKSGQEDLYPSTATVTTPVITSTPASTSSPHRLLIWMLAIEYSSIYVVMFAIQYTYLRPNFLSFSAFQLMYRSYLLFLVLQYLLYRASKFDPTISLSSFSHKVKLFVIVLLLALTLFLTNNYLPFGNRYGV